MKTVFAVLMFAAASLLTVGTVQAEPWPGPGEDGYALAQVAYCYGAACPRPKRQVRACREGYVLYGGRRCVPVRAQKQCPYMMTGPNCDYPLVR
jgi:hypothetical protein